MSLLSLPVSSKSMKEIWLSMPDSFIPYLDASKKASLIDLAANGTSSEVTNLLDGNTAVEELTSDYLRVSLTKNSSIQIKRLPNTKGDSIICVVRTFEAPVAESTVCLYSSSWDLIKNESWSIEEVAQKPDTMSQEEYKELLSWMDSALISASLNPKNNELQLQLSSPFVDQEEKSKLSKLILQRKINWNGQNYK